MNHIFFAQNLYILRKRAGLKQHDMQEKLGIMRNTWSNWENGKAEPDMEAICRIAEFFGEDVGKLITGDISENISPGIPIVQEPHIRYPGTTCIECELKEEIIASQKQTIKALAGQAEALKESLELIKQKRLKKSP